MDNHKILKTISYITFIPLILSILTIVFSPVRRENYKYLSINELEFYFNSDYINGLIEEKYVDRMNRMELYEPIIHSIECAFCICNLIIILLFKKRKIYLIPSFYFNLIFSILCFLLLILYCWANGIVYYKVFDDLNYFKRFFDEELPFLLKESLETRKILFLMLIFGIISFLIHFCNICLYCIVINDENRLRNNKKIEESKRNKLKTLGEKVAITTT